MTIAGGRITVMFAREEDECMCKIGFVTAALVLVFLMFVAVSVFAYDFGFYEGGLSFRSVDVVVGIDGDAQVTASYVVVNDGGTVVDVAFSSLPEGADIKVNGVAVGATTSFSAGQQRTVVVSYELSPVGDGNLKVLRIAPELLLDGGMFAGTVDTFDVGVTLPSGIPALAASSRLPDSVEVLGGRAVASWSATDAYPTALTVQWNMLGADVAVSASADTGTVTAVGQEVEVDVVVENRGSTALQGVGLECSFPPSDFEGVSPPGSFEVIEPEGSDPRLVWSESIASLGAGQSQTVSFTLSVLNAAVNISLEPVRVTVGGELVGTSDHVFFEVNLTGIVKTETAETTTTITTQTPGPGVIAAITASVLVLIILHRRR